MKKRIYISFYIALTPFARAYFNKMYMYQALECSSIDEANTIAEGIRNYNTVKDVKIYKSYKFIQTIKNFINR
jgi:hypothetical protein